MEQHGCRRFKWLRLESISEIMRCLRRFWNNESDNTTVHWVSLRLNFYILDIFELQPTCFSKTMWGSTVLDAYYRKKRREEGKWAQEKLHLDLLWRKGCWRREQKRHRRGWKRWRRERIGGVWKVVMGKLRSGQRRGMFWKVLLEYLTSQMSGTRFSCYFSFLYLWINLPVLEACLFWFWVLIWVLLKSEC